MKYPKPDTKEWKELVQKKVTELKLALDKEFVASSPLWRKRRDFYVGKDK